MISDLKCNVSKVMSRLLTDSLCRFDILQESDDDQWHKNKSVQSDELTQTAH